MQLTVEQCGFELGRSIYMQIFFDKYMYPTILYYLQPHKPQEPLICCLQETQGKMENNSSCKGK